MPEDEPPVSLEDVQQFAREAASVGQAVAQFALQTAYSTGIFREPDVESIDDIDAQIGSKDDVEDPLLTAHRLAKFYLISAGDALQSCCELVGRDHPMHVGSAGLARVTAEHASRTMFLSSTDIDWRTRVLRTNALFVAAAEEYKSSSDEIALYIIESWRRWKARTSTQFVGAPKQSAKSARNLIEKHFDHPLGYDELSRPTHGNAVWLTLAVIQEQKQTNYTWCATLRNIAFAIECVLKASLQLGELWKLQPESLFAEMRDRLGIEDPSTNWDWFISENLRVQSNVDYLSRTVVIDGTPEPQPRR